MVRFSTILVTVLAAAPGNAEPGLPATPSTTAGGKIGVPPPHVSVTEVPPPHVSVTEDPSDREARSLDLRPLGNGYFYKGHRPGERFDAKVLHDGKVEFHIDPEVTVRIDGICLLAICIQTKAARSETPRRKAKRTAWTVAAMLLAEAAASAAGHDSPSYLAVDNPVMDPTAPRQSPPVLAASVQGRYGYLPAPIAAMQAFMERTFDLRLQMAQKAAIENLELARQRIPQTLAELWSDPKLSIDERKTAILELWLELDPIARHMDSVLVAASPLECAQTEAAAAVRHLVVESVNRHAPPGSRRAFTEAELAEFAAQPETRIPFRPYDPDPPQGAVSPSCGAPQAKSAMSEATVVEGAW